MDICFFLFNIKFLSRPFITGIELESVRKAQVQRRKKGDSIFFSYKCVTSFAKTMKFLLLDTFNRECCLYAGLFGCRILVKNQMDKCNVQWKPAQIEPEKSSSSSSPPSLSFWLF